MNSLQLCNRCQSFKWNWWIKILIRIAKLLEMNNLIKKLYKSLNLQNQLLLRENKNRPTSNCTSNSLSRKKVIMAIGIVRFSSNPILFFFSFHVLCIFNRIASHHNVHKYKKKDLLMTEYWSKNRKKNVKKIDDNPVWERFSISFASNVLIQMWSFALCTKNKILECTQSMELDGSFFRNEHIFDPQNVCWKV